ncbi:hypothetical protein EYC80_004782 [Monilinia laxa]|uniref:Uncharacterized protein n=1 Tax=Monilinia laxa TaxID=61186 RepID=A0A5N6KHU1_MONLA|nr:hypothetical protein EYC80_004782 [Monilinia laxa]
MGGGGYISKARYIWNSTCIIVAEYIGSVWAYTFYWISIFSWVGIGPLFQFSDTWQLYVNTVTAVALTITSIFLEAPPYSFYPNEKSATNVTLYPVEEDDDMKIPARQVEDRV